MIADLKANPTTTAKVNEQGRTMAEQDSAPGVDLYHVAHVVSSYVRHHRVAADQLAGLIVEVHRTLSCLGRAPPVQQPLRPAVPIRRSVQPDYVVCLECGFRG